MDKQSSFLLRLQKILFPLIMALLSLLSFIAVYILVVTYPISPFYLRGLLFGIPTICFVIIAVLAYQDVIKTSTSTLLTIIMIILSLFISIGGLVSLAIESAEGETTDIEKYERVLSRLGSTNNPALSIFPASIPEQAENAQLLYYPALFQGGEVICLKYQINHEVIQSYQTMLARRAIQVGDARHFYTEETGITESDLLILDYETKGFPKDLILYFTYSRPSHPNNWNHGTSTLVAISEMNSEILFYYESW